VIRPPLIWSTPYGHARQLAVASLAVMQLQLLLPVKRLCADIGHKEHGRGTRPTAGVAQPFGAISNVVQCLSPIQSCSSTLSTGSTSSRQQQLHQQMPATAPTACNQDSKHQEQQMQQMQQRRCRPSEQAQLQQPGLTFSAVCAVVGMRPAAQGAAAFTPAWSDAPGPLLYSPEWHACRSSCTARMPGCYVRRDHYYMPRVDVKGKRAS